MDSQLTELPILRLALAGFTPAEQEIIGTAAAQVTEGLAWRFSASLSEADAVFINGRRIAPWQAGGVRIDSPTPGGPVVCIDLNDWQRPLAFSAPMAIAGMAGADSFDLLKPQSVGTVLTKFGGWLRPMAVQFWLASRIVKERLDLVSSVYHISVDGRLQAVVSRRNGIGVLPIADPSRLASAVWARRPTLADEIPGHFVQTALAEALWQYAMRTTRDLLPTYFRSGPIYWCRAPQLPQRMFRDSHLMIVRELAHAPASYADLGRRTGLSETVLARDLAALRLVGAVTQDRKQALRITPQPSGDPVQGSEAAKFRSHGTAPNPTFKGQGVALGDKTAPAPLTPQSA